jgi:hypothetical protein
MPNEEGLVAEARTFAAYLGASSVPPEIAERYRMVVAAWERQGFDAWLGRIAAAHPVLASLADAYARRAWPYGDLRRRLTLMLALLESHGTTHAAYDRASPAPAAVVWLMLAGFGTLWVVRTLLAFLLFAPLHLVSRLAARA